MEEVGREKRERGESIWIVRAGGNDNEEIGEIWKRKRKMWEGGRLKGG